MRRRATRVVRPARQLEKGTASQLKERFPVVDVSHLPENDERWDAEVLEEGASGSARRGVAALQWLGWNDRKTPSRS